MNERIKQLALEAKAQYCDLGDASCFKRLGLVEAVVFTPEDLEKFAELIVQECLNQCYNRGMDDELYAGQLKAATYIEEYFGVEE
jgi:hypothetical protein